ncbi:MAG: chromosomal replication initiator protein DnaA [Candidatus Omnitrophica bacterium]|nr:chromosomal replication initiator protein DnaA [Candidatus Omnitrophota bacterium]MBU1925350.1 chromosomal replication initiator protein DnaA [Candidatus Omnitrophota bacterium]
MQKDATELWAQILSVIKGQITPQSFETWLKPTRPLGIAEDVVSIEVPNKFFKEWLSEHYHAALTKVLRQITGSDLKIDFVASNTTSALEVGEALNSLQSDSGSAVPERRPDIYLNPKYTFESFVVGPSNRFAHAASTAVADSPARAYNPLFIYGGVGLGKTHLMQALGQHILQHNGNLKLTYTTSERFTNQLITAIQKRTTMRFREKYRNVDILLIDDIQFIAGKESTQEEFFHTFNTLYDSHKQIVLSSDRSPKDIPGLEERLISRFEWGLITDIQPPDLETRVAILKKKAEREIVAVPDEVMFFIAEKIRSNIRELEGALIRVVAYALLTNNPLSTAVAKEVLKDAIREGPDNSVVTIERVQKVVAEKFDVKVLDIKKGGRSKAIAYPRHIAMYLARELTRHSLSEIGEGFGGRDHTTVLHAFEKIKLELKKNPQLQELLTTLINRINGR